MKSLFIIALISILSFNSQANDFDGNQGIETEEQQPNLETNYFGSAGLCKQLASAGSGSLVAQDTGLRGLGFDQDVVIWPENCSVNGNETVVSFQVSVKPQACPYIAVVWDREAKFQIVPIAWGGKLLDKVRLTNSYVRKNPGGWFHLVAWYAGFEGNRVTIGDAPIAASCGKSKQNAYNRAMKLARQNDQ